METTKNFECNSITAMANSGSAAIVFVTVSFAIRLLRSSTAAGWLIESFVHSSAYLASNSMMLQLSTGWVDSP